jgi:hypothetical protein
MLYRVTAISTDGSLVTWVTSYPRNPWRDYYPLGAQPTKDNLGSYELTPIPAGSEDGVWEYTPSDPSSVYPVSGAPKSDQFWKRTVDTTTDVILRLSNENTSTTWVRLNETDITPRRRP